MQNVTQFKDFIESEVELKSSNIRVLERCVAAVDSFLRNSDFTFEILGAEPQGSWAHGTIIHPQEGKEFDADLIVYVSYIQGAAPCDYIDEIEAAFLGSNRYKAKVVTDPCPTRCVTLSYARKFHLDVVPCVVKRGSNGVELSICNRKTDTFEPTAPRDYTDWLLTLDTYIGKPLLTQVVQLIKYQRDIKRTFSAKSIIITTLLGSFVRNGDRGTPEFASVPAALRTLVGRIDDWLKPQTRVPRIENPKLRGEFFTRHWDDERFLNFKKCWARYREWIEDAFWEADERASIRKWQYVFGDAFGRGVDVSGARSKGVLRRLHLDLNPWVIFVAELGADALQDFPSNAELPFVEPDLQLLTQVPIRVCASLHGEQYGPPIRSLKSGDVVPSGCWIRFESSPFQGYADGFQTEWRVANTGTAAFDLGQQRGGYSIAKGNVHWEETKYRGVHFVEVFYTKRKGRSCLGKSDRFFVVIDR